VAPDDGDIGGPFPNLLHFSTMRHILTVVCLLACVASCGVLAPVIEAQRETLARVAAMEAQVEAARGAAVEVQRQYEAGEVSEAERDAALDRIRAETLDALAAVRDALAATGRAVEDIDIGEAVEGGLREAAPLLPPPFDSLAAALAALAGAYGLSRRAEARVHAARDAARALRGEPLDGPRATGTPPKATDLPGSVTLAVARRRP
jgi:hypothetical protein